MSSLVLDEITVGLAAGRVVPYLGAGMLALVPGGSPVPATPEALAAAINENRADFVLREGVVGLFFADVEALGGRGSEREKFGGREVIVENAVGLFEEALGFEGDEFRIAGSGADEVDLVHTASSRGGSSL